MRQRVFNISPVISNNYSVVFPRPIIIRALTAGGFDPTDHFEIRLTRIVTFDNNISLTATNPLTFNDGGNIISLNVGQSVSGLDIECKEIGITADKASIGQNNVLSIIYDEVFRD